MILKAIHLATGVAICCDLAAPRVLISQLPSRLPDIGKVVFAVGSLEGVDALGSIFDLDVSERGRVAVLDHLTPQVRVYSRDGELTATFGRSGEGPGEWDWPSSVVWLDGETLGVLSQGHRRIHIYDSHSGTLVDEIRLPLLARDFCVLNRRVFLLGLRAGAVVHEIDREGGLLSSFGASEELPPDVGVAQEMTREWSSDGRLVCDSPRRRIFQVPFNLPTVVAYDPEGGVVWRTTLPEYRQLRWERSERGFRGAGDPETGTSHSMRATVVLEDGSVLVQLVESSRGALEEHAAPEARVLDGASGRESSVVGLPGLIRGLGGGRVAVYDDTLYPRIVIHALGG